MYIFTTLGLEPAGRIGSGVAELVAVVLLLIARTAVLGALLALGVITGAIGSHLTKLGIVVQGDGGGWGAALCSGVRRVRRVRRHRADPPVPDPVCLEPLSQAMSMTPSRRILITAGPTHEPIDAVRYLGNRSSGRMGVALADAAADAGWGVTLLLGPVAVRPANPSVVLRLFTTCDDLRTLLREHAPSANVLIMAAAVADYRPKPNPAMSGGKFRRTDAAMTLELEPTPDLLAEVAASRRPDQLFVGFALEPRAELLESARAKLVRKKVDLVVANPLETMDSPSVEAIVLAADGTRIDTPGIMPKADFAAWLMRLLGQRHAE